MKPVFMREEMVKAIKEDRKKYFRIAIDRDITNFCDVDIDGTLVAYENSFGDFVSPVDLCKFKVGDVLYVREQFAYSHSPNNKHFVYKADGEPSYPYYGSEDGIDPMEKRWLSPVSMPRDAARIFLKVKSIKVKKLQDMNYFDCLEEGIPYKQFEKDIINDFSKYWDASLTEKKQKYYKWSDNPWVWVIEFERCEKEGFNIYYGGIM